MPFSPTSSTSTTAKRPTAPRKPKATFSRKKNCFFCQNREFEPDYKDTAKLRRYISDRGRIVPQSKTRTCAKHQRAITNAIKQARTMALFA